MIITLKHTEIEKTADLMEEFHNSSERLHGFNRDVYVKSWGKLVESGIGFAYLEEDRFGMLLGTISNDLYDGEKNACVAVWYVDPYNRGVGIGQELYNAFELDAVKLGAKRIVGGYSIPAGKDITKAFYRNGLLCKEVLCGKRIGG